MSDEPDPDDANDDGPVRYERDGPVAVITIDRPERRNAIDYETSQALLDAFTRVEESDAKAAVLTGADGTFSAGADLKAMDLEDSPEGWLGFTRTRCEVPVIAAVEGHCVAGGIEMACWCDIRIAAEGATFGCFERRFGVPLVDGGTQRLPRIVGLGRALDMILTGRAVDAETAERWGLATRTCDEGAARETAVELGKQLAGFPQDTMLSDRAAVYDGVGTPLQQGLGLEGWHGSRVFGTAEAGADRFAGGEGRGGEGIENPDG